MCELSLVKRQPNQRIHLQFHLAPLAAQPTSTPPMLCQFAQNQLTSVLTTSHHRVNLDDPSPDDSYHMGQPRCVEWFGQHPVCRTQANLYQRVLRFDFGLQELPPETQCHQKLNWVVSLGSNLKPELNQMLRHKYHSDTLANLNCVQMFYQIPVGRRHLDRLHSFGCMRCYYPRPLQHSLLVIKCLIGSEQLGDHMWCSHIQLGSHSL